MTSETARRRVAGSEPSPSSAKSMCEPRSPRLDPIATNACTDVVAGSLTTNNKAARMNPGGPCARWIGRLVNRLELAGAVLHLGLQAGEDGAVHLADARFGEIERGADFLHRHALVVVQDDDQSLGPAEPVGDQVLEVATLNFLDRAVLAVVANDVDLAEFTPAIAARELAGDAVRADGGSVALDLVELLAGELQVSGELGVGGGPAVGHL